MRGLLVTSLILLAVLLSACKGKGGDASAAPDPEALKAQQDLIARRDALMQQKQSMESEVTKLDTEIQEKKAKNEDTTDLEKKKSDLEAKIKGQDSDVSNLSNKIDQVLAGQGNSAAAIATREAQMGSREKGVAAREKEIAERERALAQREAQLAVREKETCGAATPMIIQAPAKSGGSYSKSDVQPLLTKAKDIMRKKGILTSDLPSGAESLEKAATDAMGANDWGKAFFAAQSLVQIVDGIKIDRLFIQGKMARMNKQVSQSKVDEETNKQLLAALSEVTTKYNDGNYSAANTRLNALAQQINK